MDAQTGKGLRLAMTLGVGLGLIGASVLVALFPQFKALTNAEIMERARALGMERLSEMPKADPTRTQVPAPPQIVTRTLVMVQVMPSSTFQEIAALLKEGGAITDADAFVRQVSEKGVLIEAQAGVYTISVGDTVDQIIDRLTRPPQR